jgi:hypothetical protein
MNPTGQANTIVVSRTNNDPGVTRSLPMQFDEVPTIES